MLLSGDLDASAIATNKVILEGILANDERTQVRKLTPAWSFPTPLYEQGDSLALISHR